MVSPFLGKIVLDLSATWDAETKENFKLKSSDNQLMEILDPLAVAGAELGLENMLGTTANIYGLSQTSLDHGTFLTQLTTLLVTTAQGMMGVPTERICTAIRLPLAGVFMQWSFQLLWQIAFTFNAKVMATAPKTAQGDAVFDVGDEA